MKIYNLKSNNNINILNKCKTLDNDYKLKAFIDNRGFKKTKYHDSKRYLSVPRIVESVMKKVKQLHFKKIEIASKSASKSDAPKHINITESDKKNSVIFVMIGIIGYVLLYTLYSKWKRLNEMKRVQESIDQYERDKMEYIETGHTR